MGKKLSYQEMKKIVKDIYEEERTNYNLDVNVYPMTLVDYYSSDIFSQNLKLTKSPISTVLLPMTSGGYADTTEENTVVIFLSGINKIKKTERKLSRLIEICYHELWHQQQKTFDDFSYDGFLKNIDAIMARHSISDYLTEHPKYSFEIGANLYGITKTKEYLKKNYPNLYEKEKEYLEKLEQKYLFYYKTYDASANIDRAIEILSKDENQLSPDNKEYENKLLPILSIFLNENLKPKKIKEIISNPKFKEIDKRIVYAFLSSKTFLESINFEQLNQEELTILSEALGYTNKLYQNQLSLLTQEKNINLLEFLKIERNILKKIQLVGNYTKIQIKHRLNFRRNDSQKIEHMQSIPDYIEQTNQQIRKRGYIKIHILYILSSILSITTIVYLLIKK